MSSDRRRAKEERISGEWSARHYIHEGLNLLFAFMDAATGAVVLSIVYVIDTHNALQQM